MWTQGRMGSGYGRARSRGEFFGRAAHRMVWEAFNGPVHDGLELDHRCRFRLCCNEAHLELVTRSENGIRRNRANGRGGPWTS